MSNSKTETMAKTKTKICVFCRKKEMHPDISPFCSKRCADLDLGSWLSERYVITAPLDDDSFHSDDPDSMMDHEA